MNSKNVSFFFLWSIHSFISPCHAEIFSGSWGSNGLMTMNPGLGMHFRDFLSYSGTEVSVAWALHEKISRVC